MPFTTDQVAKLKLADQYFAQASALAPHNPDILDEWGFLDIQLGGVDIPNAHTWFADALQHLTAARSLYPEDGVVYRDLGTVYSQYAVWADRAGKHQEALADYKQAAAVWLTALKYAAPDYQKIYPRLVQIYLTELKEPCNAGQYALYGLKALQAGTLTDSNGQVKAQLQAAVSSARSHGCTLSST